MASSALGSGLCCGRPSATPTAALSCGDTGRPRIATLTFGRWTVQQLGLTWCVEGSPVSPSASRDSGSPSATSDGCGPSSRESSASSSRESSSSRTCQGCGLLACETCWPDLPISGSMRSGRVSRQEKIRSVPTGGRTSERHTNDGDSFSLLPTPTASRYGANRGGSQGRSGKERASLETLARHGAVLLMTPTASTGTAGPIRQRSGGPTLIAQLGARKPRAVLPTPTVCGNYNRAGASPTSGDGVATAVGGQLHPRFTEWMMGFPRDWTQPSAMTAEEAKEKRASMRKRPTRGE